MNQNQSILNDIELELAKTGLAHAAEILRSSADALEKIDLSELTPDKLQEYFQSIARIHRNLADHQEQQFAAAAETHAALKEYREQLESVRTHFRELLQDLGRS